MDINSIRLLVATIIERALMDSAATRGIPYCEATNVEHKAPVCAREFLIWLETIKQIDTDMDFICSEILSLNGDNSRTSDSELRESESS